MIVLEQELNKLKAMLVAWAHWVEGGMNGVRSNWAMFNSSGSYGSTENADFEVDYIERCFSRMRQTPLGFFNTTALEVEYRRSRLDWSDRRNHLSWLVRRRKLSTQRRHIRDWSRSEYYQTIKYAHLSLAEASQTLQRNNVTDRDFVKKRLKEARTGGYAERIARY